MRLLPLLFACFLGTSLAETRLPQNGDFEQVDPSGKPVAWQPLVIGAPAEFTLDHAISANGRTSMKITASEITRAYIVSDEILVSPGEKIAATMRVIQTNVPPGKGTVIAIAEFTDAQHRQQSVAKIAMADLSKTQWQLLSGTAMVPDGAAYLRLRLGFSYAQGTCWWDQVQITIARALSGRFEVLHGRLSPADGKVPITILNRAGLKTEATVKAQVGSSVTTNFLIQLTGELVQTVQVPARIDRPGKLVLAASIWTNGAMVSHFTGQATVPPEFTLDPLIPTHWVTEDGEPRIQSRAHVALPKAELEKAVLRIRLLDRSQKLCGETSLNRLADGPNDFSLQTPVLPEGDYTLQAEVSDASTPVRPLSQPWAVIPRKKAYVTLTREGFPVYGSQVIFPLGVFNGGARMQELGTSGFTVSHAYNSVEAQAMGQPDDARAKAFLDASERAGLKALMLIPRQALFAQDWDAVRRRILMFRNHPGLLAWDEEEGVARGDIKPEVLRHLARLIKENDPHHPLIVGDSRDVIGRIPPDRSGFFLNEAMDIGMWWWYPFPTSKTKNLLEGDEAGSAEDLQLPAFLVNARDSKPLWVGIQAYKKPGPSTRYPTQKEYRFQAYAAICAGARGLMWYGGSVTGGAYLNVEEANWDFIKELAREIAQLSPVITGQTLSKPEPLPSSAPISAIIKKGGGRTLLFAVNRSFNKVEATVPVAGLQTALLLPGKQAVRLTNQSLQETFEPLEVRVYELSE